MKRCTAKFTGSMRALIVLLLMPAFFPAAVADEGKIEPLAITMEGCDYP